METTSTLYSELESKKTYFRTDNYSMSIGELVNMYRSDELIIKPEYQRLFRWTYGQKVRLIESLMLGIPLPTIFIFQNENGIWELVDGLQRISTILQFMNELKGENKLVLSHTEYLTHFENVCWFKENDSEIELDNALKLSFKRTKLNFTIIYSESDPKAKFEVFQRLNTGGSNASKQEIRNSIQIMIKPSVYAWFSQLANNEHFLNTLSLTDRLLDEQYHLELLLRFVALTNFPYDNKKELGDFLDDINKVILYDENFPFEPTKNKFLNTFELLDNALSDRVFKKFDGHNFKGKFLESSFEEIAIGIAENIDSYIQNNISHRILTEKIRSLYSEDFYKNNAGSGSNAKSRINKIVPAAIDFFKV